MAISLPDISRSRLFWTTLCTIIASVVSGLLVYYLTRPNKGTSEPPSTYEFKYGDFESTEVPITFPRESEGIPSGPHIDVTVNNKRIRLPIDTGNNWGTISLSPSNLSKIDVRYTGKTKEHYDWKGDKYDSRQYVIPTVKIGGLALTDLPSYEFRSRYEDTPGVIGLVFLRQFNVLIDYPKKRFGLYRPDVYPAYVKSKGWAKVKLSSPMGLPVKLKGYDETFSFTMDTLAFATDEEHNSYGLIRSQSALGKLLLESESLKPFPEDSEVLGIFDSEQLRTSSGYEVVNLNFMVGDYTYPKTDGMLGHNFFAEYSVFIDFRKQEMYVKSRGVH